MADGAGPNTTATQQSDDRRRRRALLWWWLSAALIALVLLVVLASCLPRGPSTGDGSDGARPTSTSTTGPTATESPTATGSPTATATPTGSATPTSAASPTSPSTSSGGGASGGPGVGGSSGAGGGGGTTGVPFTMTASVSNGALIPGTTRTLVVRVHNPNASVIRLLAVDVSVGDPGRAGCSPAWITVGNYRAGRDPRMVVRANGSGTLSVPILLVNLPSVDQNGCQGATFPLTLDGSAAQVIP